VKVVHYNRIHWDFTTLVLKKCLRQQIKQGQKVLEIGTGPYAILSIFLAKHFYVDITACDINKEYVHHARKTINLNGTQMEVIHSDLFSNIHDSYDIIIFNAVYIPKHIGIKLGIQKLHDTVTDWCGGETGIEIIQLFLSDAPLYMRPHAKVLLGFNPRYLQINLLAKLTSSMGYRLITYYNSFFNPSVVYVLERNQE